MDDKPGITESTSQKKNNVLVPLTIVGLIVIVVAGVLVSQGQEKKVDLPKAAVETVQVTKRMDAATVTSAKSEYKDGEYKAVGDYMSPGGAEQVGVTVTLKGDVIESAEVQTMGDRPNTVKFQGIFKENFKPFVVGKNINEVKLDKVSSSSLTPKGFNDALDKVKQEAKV